MSRILPYLTILLMAIAPLIVPAQSMGNGHDGSPSISGIINDYAELIRTAGKCDTALLVSTTSGFETGDLVLILQMEGADINPSNSASYGNITAYNNTGNFEYARIKEIEGNTFYLDYPVINDYNAETHAQVVRVPEYRTPHVTGVLTAQNWNGKTGGVLAMDVLDTLVIDAPFNTTGTGFRGGRHHTAQCVFDLSFEYFAETDPQYYAKKGEGIAGYGVEPFTSGRGAPANAGGGGNIHTSGGGGGALGGSGGDGGWGYPVDGSGNEVLVYGIGGHALSPAIDRLFMGGGGGAGHEHYGNGTSGANGGGIVLISANYIDGNNQSIFNMGANAPNGGAYGDGAGGGGAGGTVFIACPDILSPVNIMVSGGRGGSTIAQGFGPGGGGSGGILIYSGTGLPTSLTTNINGGVRGTAGGNSYGGSNGADGVVLTGATIPMNTGYPAVYADFSATPGDLSYDNIYITDQTHITFNNLSTGGTQSLWDFGDNQSSSASGPDHDFVMPGSYTITLIESNDLCSDTAIYVLQPDAALPNVFTPNDDGVNDLFSMPSGTAENASLHIFSRFGELLYEGSGAMATWDGKTKYGAAPEGVYYYTFKLIMENDQVYEQHGYLHLLR